MPNTIWDHSSCYVETANVRLYCVMAMKKVTGAWNYTNQFLTLVPNYLCGLKAK
jgi:hypothetical protein